MTVTLEEYFHDFRQRLLAEAEIRQEFQLSAFLNIVCTELEETGFINGFEHCHYRGRRSLRADGYLFSEEGTTLDLHLADFQNRATLEPLHKSNISALFKKGRGFIRACRDKALHEGLDESTSEYRLARGIFDRQGQIQRINFVLTSDRYLSTRSKSISSHDLDGAYATYAVWDMSRLHRQYCSRSGQEPLDVDFGAMFKKGLPCLRANVGTKAFPSYLAVVSGEALAKLYDEYGARLLEQNVRCFLQARGSVNRGIRDTIVNEPHMFFAYNNGLTATAQKVHIEDGNFGSEITRIVDLQIVNGGQTAASLYHASKKKDAPDLSQIFVQMKLSVVSDKESEELVSKIALYANTQNKVNAADLRSNHPFHIRIEEFSRRMWAPALEGKLRETKWFYERARGQYQDQQSKMTLGEKKLFRAQYPSNQKFTKTDLAKFENVWDEDPYWVNKGAQKNFIQYAQRIGLAWSQAPDRFDEAYYRRSIARAIVFKATERLVTRQEWYAGGYRANIVAYTLAAASELGKRRNMALDFVRIWNTQSIDSSFANELAIIAKLAFDVLHQADRPVQNCSEWAKREEFWHRMKQGLLALEQNLTDGFWCYFVLA